MSAQVIMIIGLSAASWFFMSLTVVYKPCNTWHRFNRVACATVSACAGLLAISELIALCR